MVGGVQMVVEIMLCCMGGSGVFPCQSPGTYLENAEMEPKGPMVELK